MLLVDDADVLRAVQRVRAELVELLLQRRVLDTLPFGGGCINDTIIHLATSRMPFGGVGHSGMGDYHGRDSFRCFTHDKSIVKKALWLDLPMRYTPYSKKKETLIRFFLK